MSYKATDGREFTHAGLYHNYQRGLDEDAREQLAQKSAQQIEDAPGGPEHEANIKAHGPVLESTIKYDGAGRWRHIATHRDGSKSESVHPEAFRAQQIQGRYFGIDEPPPAIKTHQRSRQVPTGEREQERQDREDGRQNNENA